MEAEICGTSQGVIANHLGDRPAALRPAPKDHFCNKFLIGNISSRYPGDFMSRCWRASYVTSKSEDDASYSDLMGFCFDFALGSLLWS